MNKLVKAVNKENITYEYLKTLNGILDLTERELDLLAKLIELDKAHDPAQGHKNVIKAENRKLIKKELGITPDNLSRYLSRFKEKGYIVKGKADDEWSVHKMLIPELIKDRVQLTIILKTNE